MSEFHVNVVRLGPISKHPNADSLSITMIGGDGGYPVILRTGDFQEGDRAVYVPVGAAVPASDPRWAFLVKPGATKPYVEIDAKKLRGVFSMGLLTSADASWDVGRDVAAELGIVRAEEVDTSSSGSAENEADPGLMPTYTDIEGLRAQGRVTNSHRMPATVIRRQRPARATVPDVAVIDAPDQALCALPASRRLCVATACGAALTPRLGRMAHKTGCAFDEGGLVPDERYGTLERRRADCLRLYRCEERWIVASADGGDSNAQARCPEDCHGFVAVGNVVPLSALNRARRAPQA